MQHDHAVNGLTHATGSGGFFSRLFESDFIPRAVCMGEQPEIIWLHVISDSLIALSYYSIPIALIVLLRRRRDLAFNWMFAMFAAFILACGTTHVFDVLAIWRPTYRLDGTVRLATAAISTGTAVALWPLIPRIVRLPSPGDLTRTNTELERQIRERHWAEHELREAHSELEAKVQARTAELAAANESLQAEIAERKRAEQRQSLMMSELDHRVKNNMATVLSLAEQTARSAGTVEGFLDAFMGRVGSMARLHDSLARSKWGGTELMDLVNRTLEPYQEEGARRVIIEGERVHMAPRMGLAVVMTLHELATNAVKYGALSVPAGQVRVAWRVEPKPDTSGDRLIRMTWEERGGPAVKHPERRGFGTTLIEQGIKYELRGVVRLEFPLEGLRCELSWTVGPTAEPDSLEHSVRTGGA